MTRLARLPIRVRVTAAFAVVMIVLLTGLGLALYLSLGSALLDELDSGLRFRVAALAPVAQREVIEGHDPTLEEPTEAFDQLLAADGTVLRVTPGISDAPLLTSTVTNTLTGPRFFTREVPGVGTARLLAVALTGADKGKVLVVGTTMADRKDALRLILLVLAVGGPLAVALASTAGWVVAGWALRPVESMRRQASAITASGLDRRLDVPSRDDELRRLAETLNEMLSRLDDAMSSERRFLEQASHEMRTPLAALKAELDLARSSPRSAEEMSAAMASAAEETDRLARLADDLLSLARMNDGQLPIKRGDVRLDQLVRSAASLFASRAAGLGVRIDVAASPFPAYVDAMRMRQAIDNVLDNALRHSPRGGAVTVELNGDADEVRIGVADDGPGFEHLAAGESAESLPPVVGGRRGLGLQIVAAVAASHAGRLVLGNRIEGGAVVVLVLPRSQAPD